MNPKSQVTPFDVKKPYQKYGRIRSQNFAFFCPLPFLLEWTKSNGVEFLCKVSRRACIHHSAIEWPNVSFYGASRAPRFPPVNVNLLTQSDVQNLNLVQNLLVTRQRINLYSSWSHNPDRIQPHSIWLTCIQLVSTLRRLVAFAWTKTT